MAVMEQAGLDALHRLKSTDPPQWLAPSPDFSQAARTAAKHLFSSLNPHAPKSPFDQLLVDGFDAEQIWQQIDLQSKPLLSMLSREIKRFEKNPEEISKLKDVLVVKKKAPVEKSEVLEVESDDIDDELDEGFDEEDGDEDGEGESEEEGSEDEDEEDEEEGEGVEDKFLKIKELKDYLKKDEAGEFGLKKKKKGDSKKKVNTEEADEEEDEEEDDELELFGDDDGDEEEVGDKLARYEDFFGSTKKKTLKRESGLIDGSEDSATDEEEGEEEQEEEDDEEEEEEDDDVEDPEEKKGSLSTHEKELEKVRSKIEQMEKANLEEKTWTMQGEVTAAKRPKNSALEVDLDFEHNVRPAPVITEEVTASLEELIQKRILEGRFDDVQKAPRLSTKAPREIKELDENKSKKGLAEVYEEEYVQKADPTSAPLTFSDEQKKEASTLFKRLCLKLDALSHFHFAPKPVIEDMSIQTNVPALAMEEIAPVAVSDAAMLAPEEVFAGKGDIKEEAELTQAERKRRRANKKRKYKAETIMRMGNKAQKITSSTPNAGKEE